MKTPRPSSPLARLAAAAAAAALALTGVVLSLPAAVADEVTQKKPTPPNFSAGGKTPPPAPGPPTPPAPGTPPVQVGTPMPPAPAPAPGPTPANGDPTAVPPPPGFQNPNAPGAPPPPAVITPPVVAPNVPAGGLVNPADRNGFLYEKNRIKRTVPLDVAAGVEGRWDVLYTVGDGPQRQTVFFDWDDQYLYLAAQSAAPIDVRFDLDARGDGWFRGADNVSILVGAAVGPGQLPQVTAQRWDTVQNKERPVWAASPIPVSSLKVAAGTTPAGAYAVLVAVPNTEAAGLARRAGASFGLRAEVGPQTVTDDVALFTPRPMLPLTLAERVEARGSGLRVQVKASPERIVPGDGIRLFLEIKNDGTTDARIARLFVRGSQAAQPLLDAATFTGQTLRPGETLRRSLSSAVAPGAGLGTHVAAGGGEVDDGNGSSVVLASLASFDLLDPYAATLKFDDAPVKAGASEKKTVLVSVLSRRRQRAPAEITLQLPETFAVDGGRERRLTMTFEGEIKGAFFKVGVPAGTPAGVYPVRADVRVGGRSYAAFGNILVAPAGPETVVAGQP